MVFGWAMFGGESNFAGVMSHAAQVGANTVITYRGDEGYDHTITLLDVIKTSLKADDFLFG